MSRSLVLTTAVGLFVAIAPQVATTQDFRVYTKIQDLTTKSARRADRDKCPVIGRSRTLFHANKVYDYIQEIDEVVIVDFNTGKRDFSLLSTRREMAATIHFDEVRKKLQEAIEVGDQTIQKMEADDDPRDRDVIALYRFQSAPVFEERFITGKHELDLKSKIIKYEVKTAKPPQPGFVEAYCRYADAICQLNFVLHPSLLRPEPRLKLNESLARHGELPTTVQLDINQTQRISRLATHEFRWELDQSDRQSIDTWESMIANPSIRRVPVQEYQAEILRIAAKDRK